ncbi:ferritin-like domain-containing protein [Sporichthya sp.]|uniref:ferritin-like domain-containing protein n=1 Tax=Sporichthya sp. TaxID=65475 RepID=UPI0018186B14|nr:ferritin-like domain-containing protein [Sporichthya sp.]MBA3742278.1 ferritin-like domain-containing protein [Sporichthya sp.]
MSPDTSGEMQISEAQLRAMTADMVEMHHATFPRMYAALTDVGASLRRQLRPRRVPNLGAADPARRRLLFTGSGLVAGSLLLAACGDDDEASQPAATPGGTGTGQTPAASEMSDADASMLKLNASLENLAVFAYGAALEAAPKGQFGKTFPDAVAEFAKHAMEQHADHATAFNAALTGAGQQAYTDPDPALADTVKSMFAKLDSVTGLATLALTLENTAGATYVKQMGELASPEALSAVATIAPVERQHAAILTYVLGDYPIPDTFVKFGETKTSLGARPSSDIA